MSLKKTMISFLAVCVGVTSALANPLSIKVKDFQSIGDGVMLNPRVDGMAMITPQGTGNCQLHLRMDDLEPNKLYGVALMNGDVTVPPTYQPFYSVPPRLTNSRGDLTFDATLSADENPGTNPIVYIFDWNVSGMTLSGDSVRAYGIVGRPTTPTVKIKDFDAVNPEGLCDNRDVDGMAIIKFDPLIGGSEVHLHVRGLMSLQDYIVAIQGTCSAAPDDSVGTLTTDSCGAAVYEVSTFGNDLNDPMCWTPNGIVIYIFIRYSGDPADAIPVATQLRTIATMDAEDLCRH